MDRPDIPDFFVRNSKGGGFDPDKFLSQNKWLIILIVLLFLILPNTVIVVGPGQQAVIFNRITGMEKRVLPEGVQLVIPGLQQAFIYNVRAISYKFTGVKNASINRESRVLSVNPIHVLTADGQGIDVDVTLRAQPEPGQLWWIHQNLGNDKFNSYVEKIIEPMVKSVVRQVISGYKVSAMHTDTSDYVIDGQKSTEESSSPPKLEATRKEIASKIEEDLRTELSKYKIKVLAFLLDKVEFSPKYQSSIEKKTQATIRLRRKDIEIEEQENKRDAVITRAEGEAEAIRLKVDALNRNPSFIDFRKAQMLGKRTKLIIED